MTRLEIDIDASPKGKGALVSTDLRIVRECTTPKKYAKLETSIAHTLRVELSSLLNAVSSLSTTLSTQSAPQS